MHAVDDAIYRLHKMSHRRRLGIFRQLREATAYLVRSSRDNGIAEFNIRRGRHAAWKAIIRSEREGRR